MAHEAGKGSGQRPTQIPKEEFDNNWDRIFGKKREHEVNTENYQQLYEVPATMSSTDDDKKKKNLEHNARAFDMAHSAFGRGHF